ncbi:MAG TPA: T9SS type A sorting domain-containing protein [Candidatus Cloacimonadota bacterium]|nr:T9SS type A sorting domain-containing protein [Candidatus Cloacimonadota bacterium]
MKNLILTFILSMTLISLYSINFIEANHQLTDNFSNERESTISWNHGIDDQHWYGTSKWAVRYNMLDVFGNADSVKFTPQSVKVYLPAYTSTRTDTLTVGIYTESANFPSTLIASGSVLLTNSHPNTPLGWINLNMTPINPTQYPLTRRIFWVVVNLRTSSTGPYISAENTGGAHSYFWNNTAGISPFFQSMEGTGYTSEFLVTVSGEFTYSTHLNEMELQSFGFAGDLVPNARLAPTFTVRNASSNAITGAILKVQYDIAKTELSYADSVMLPTIQPNEILNVTAENSNSYFAPFSLLSEPCQYAYTAVLNSTYEDNLDYLSNNVITGSFDTYSYTPQKVVVENFIHYTEPNQTMTNINLLLDGAEHYSGGPDSFIINYYPSPSDFVYQSEANQRYTFYSCLGYPNTVMNGVRKILGFNPLSDSLTIQNTFDDARNDVSFVTEARINQPTASGNTISLNLNMLNRNSYVFDSYLEHCRLYMALVETIPQSSIVALPSNVFIKFVAIDDTMATHLGFDDNISRAYSFSLDDIDLINSANSTIQNCSLIYFLQNIDDKRIYVSGIRSLSNITPNQDNYETPMVTDCTIYPNPCNLSSKLKILMNGDARIQSYKMQVFNIRGQKVYDFPIMKGKNMTAEWDLKNQNGKTIANGIYLIDISYEVDSKTTHLMKKIAVVKQ